MKTKICIMLFLKSLNKVYRRISRFVLRHREITNQQSFIAQIIIRGKEESR